MSYWEAMRDHANPSPSEVIGRNLRRLREERGWSQDAMARTLRLGGLPWSQSTVALAEAGTRTFTFDEFLTLAAFVGLTGLLGSDDDQVRLGAFDTKMNVVRQLLAGEYGTASPFEFEIDRRARALLRIGAADSSDIAANATGQAEQKAARRLRCSVAEVIEASARLWYRSLTQERDRLVDERAPEGASTRTLQAIRGHVTRELLEQLTHEVGKED